MAALHAIKKGSQCHDRLAGADVALQEAVHRVRGGEISGHLPDRPLLGGGQLEWQVPEELRDEARLAQKRRDDVRDPGARVAAARFFMTRMSWSLSSSSKARRRLAASFSSRLSGACIPRNASVRPTRRARR